MIINHPINQKFDALKKIERELIKMHRSKVFPVDCEGCENLIRYDMSVDDWTNICKINNMQTDDCDMVLNLCPIPLHTEYN
jgi:hypothetical protein